MHTNEQLDVSRSHRVLIINKSVHDSYCHDCGYHKITDWARVDETRIPITRNGTVKSEICVRLLSVSQPKKKKKKKKTPKKHKLNIKKNSRNGEFPQPLMDKKLAICNIANMSINAIHDKNISEFTIIKPM